MSGHSKFANIKHRKGKSDAQRGKMFTKLGREIAVAVRDGGGGNPDSNSRLADVIIKAKAANMPGDSITRSIKKAVGGGEGANYEEISYEGYGPGGIAVVVEAATDNKNRTAAEVRNYFDKYGGNLGTTGCVSFMFEKKGVIIIEKAKSVDADTLALEAIDAGADDFNAEDEFYEILTKPEDFYTIRTALENLGYELLDAEIQMIPANYIKLEDPKQEEQMAKIIDFLEDLDDVQNVYHNWERKLEEEED
jgi:YebC/PmpR family DNA-binding regulatory protein